MKWVIALKNVKIIVTKTGAHISVNLGWLTRTVEYQGSRLLSVQSLGDHVVSVCIGFKQIGEGPCVVFSQGLLYLLEDLHFPLAEVDADPDQPSHVSTP